MRRPQPCASLVVTLLVAALAASASGEPPYVPPAWTSGEAFTAAPPFLARVTSLFGAQSLGRGLAGKAARLAGKKGQLMVAETPIGPVAAVASEDRRFTLIVFPNGHVWCQGDGGCPEWKLDAQGGYEPNPDQRAPGRVGARGQAFVELGDAQVVGLVLYYLPGDGYPGSYEIHRLSRKGFDKRAGGIYSDDLDDVDGDGRIDLILRRSWGRAPGTTADWDTVRFGVGEGRFVADPVRARPFHGNELAKAVAMLSLVPKAPPVDYEHCLYTVFPMFVAHAHLALAGKDLGAIAGPVAAWMAAVPKSLPKGAPWATQCPNAQRMATCLSRRTDATEAGFNRCLRGEPD